MSTLRFKGVYVDDKRIAKFYVSLMKDLLKNKEKGIAILFQSIDDDRIGKRKMMWHFRWVREIRSKEFWKRMIDESIDTLENIRIDGYFTFYRTAIDNMKKLGFGRRFIRRIADANFGKFDFGLEILYGMKIIITLRANQTNNKHCGDLVIEF